jgi:hypothetical protein
MWSSSKNYCSLLPLKFIDGPDLDRFKTESSESISDFEPLNIIWCENEYIGRVDRSCRLATDPNAASVKELHNFLDDIVSLLNRTAHVALEVDPVSRIHT